MTEQNGDARSIDTAAHQRALAAKGRTIAVLGTGINPIVPVHIANIPLLTFFGDS